MKATVPLRERLKYTGLFFGTVVTVALLLQAVLGIHNANQRYTDGLQKYIAESKEVRDRQCAILRMLNASPEELRELSC